MARSDGAAATAACMLLAVCLASSAASPALAQNGPKLSAYIETYDELKSLHDALSQSPAFGGFKINIFFKNDITFPAGAQPFDFVNFDYALFSGKPNKTRVTLTAAPGVDGFFFHSNYGPFKASNIVFKNAATAAVSVRHLRANVIQDMYFNNCGFVGNAAAVAYDFCYSKSHFRKCNFTDNKQIFTYTNNKLAGQEPAAKIYMYCGSFTGKQGTLQSWSSVFPNSDSAVLVCPATNAIKYGKNVKSVDTCKC